jgi:hypothetical protein
MVAQVISLFLKTPSPSRDWTQQETAEFYRVESSLIQAGVQLESDRGVSDEGDPWFVFCRADNGEVFIHFARIDGFYMVDGVSFETPARGRDFAALVRSLLSQYPLATARARNSSNIFVHPAALLIALVGAAFFQTSEAKAATTAVHDSKSESRRSSLIVTSTPTAVVATTSSGQTLGEVDASQAAAILLSALLTLHEEVSMASRRISYALPDVHEFKSDPVLSNSAQELSGNLGQGARATSVELPVAMLAALEGSAGASLQTTAPLMSSASTFGPVELATGAPPQTTDQTLNLASSTPLPIASVEFSNAKPFFFIKTSPGPLPNVEAIAIVASNVALAEMVAKALPQVDRLPSSILDLISRGDHLDATAPGLGELLETSGFSVTKLETGAASEVAPPTVIDQPQQVNASTVSSTSTSTFTQSSATPAADSTTASKANDAAITAAISAFMGHVAHVDMILQGKQLVIYNRDILDPLAPRMDLDSVTIAFEDGSTLSLVGTAADLSHFHWPG